MCGIIGIVSQSLNKEDLFNQVKKISEIIEKNYKSDNYYTVNKFWKYVNAYHLIN
ncbi:hypothetical protein ACIJYE_00700 [Candidatus Pelagibacter bacterium nBUS_30]|uniref:hypothetical protein n=1 Tax=Candidatus Pelagibacter bacterium nBUS_30 TaxID=3374191 RepID=UPI003EBF5C34